MASFLLHHCSLRLGFLFTISLSFVVVIAITLFSESSRNGDHFQKLSRRFDIGDIYRKPHGCFESEAKPNSNGLNATNQDMFVYSSKGSQDEKPPHDFDFIINQSTKCVNDVGVDSNVFLMILVTTTHAHFVQRAVIRATWGSLERVFGRRVTVVFFLGRVPVTDRSLESAVEEENAYYGDIVKADFMDTYENLTLKTISILKWAKLFCPNATYVMKTDDDVFINIHNLVSHLSDLPSAQQKFVLCAKFINSKPIRNPRHKWYQSKFEFAGSTFPPYCSGPGYVMSGDVAAVAHGVALHTKPIRIEDVYFGLCLEQLGIKIQNNKWFLVNGKLHSFCKSWVFLLTWHSASPSEINAFWDIVVGKNTNTCQPNKTVELPVLGISSRG